MEEIKVGEYVRTKKGKITKVINVEIEKYEDGTTEVFIETELNPGYLDYTSKDILKHSKNIIDLIEVGDYVNKRLVLQVDYKNKNVCLLIALTDTQANTNIMWYGYEDVKTIVTKEQFASLEYKIEEE